MERYVIACDPGTGGCKASLYDTKGHPRGDIFKEYPTAYPADNRHEQKPADWVEAVKKSIQELLRLHPDRLSSAVTGIGLSGHSLGMVPLDRQGNLLMESVPIWSDSRPGPEETEPFFRRISREEWYLSTGAGFPEPLYTVFKILWLKHNHPALFAKTAKILGTKDYINYILTGRPATDYSYASGSGVYELQGWDYSSELLEAAGLPRDLFPDILPSTEILGPLLPEVAAEWGLPASVKVAAGGVDNSCMALGARCFRPGRLYNSLGSSSWIAVASDTPVLDSRKRPFVFAHVVPGLFTSATSIFAAGSCFKWLSSILYGPCADYAEMDRLAKEIPPGSDHLYFNPSLAGGSSAEKSPRIRGGFAGLSLHHTRAHMIRAVMEGAAWGLKSSLAVLRETVRTEEEITLVGGGSRSALWRQILADVLDVRILKTPVDQQAAALGAAALALAGCGIWEDFSPIDDLHRPEEEYTPNPETARLYARREENFRMLSNFFSDFGDRLHQDREQEERTVR